MNSMRIWVLVSLSTVERFSGAEVEFFISFVSWPEYTTIPNTHAVFRRMAPRCST